ncbi:hypothetical protein PHYPO_G00028640 [Pangasianodon hypophthalmus]|uniref:Formin FH3 domain-containing protein n=1 Tax=Pangasianodon hypophthalmus TaxID=310915 RepID=A0A5N5MXR8_PANHP|nr:hypothetical protein PHYPO_G00028640 [Pangasianodon hypophthalmus]
MHFLSILQHLLLIRNDYFVRPQYFKIIEECVSQIVLHRSGTDPDFSYRKRLDVDFSHLLEVCVDKARADEYEQNALELAQKVDEEIMERQEALAQLLKKEEKISELEAEIQAFRSQFGTVPVGIPTVQSVPAMSSSSSSFPPGPPSTPCTWGSTSSSPASSPTYARLCCHAWSASSFWCPSSPSASRTRGPYVLPHPVRAAVWPSAQEGVQA